VDAVTGDASASPKGGIVVVVALMPGTAAVDGGADPSGAAVVELTTARERSVVGVVARGENAPSSPTDEQPTMTSAAIADAHRVAQRARALTTPPVAACWSPLDCCR
jgi:hypothetical protein